MISVKGYTLTDKIHEGKTTEVYRGVRDSDNRPVIVKLLRNEYPTPQELAKFKQEFDITQKLDHPGIIKSLALEKAGNGYALVLEDFGGISLKETIQSKRVSIKPFLKIASLVADALAYIHSQGIIHKDIKPHNIIINLQDGKVKLTDFGISSIVKRENQNAVAPANLEGTLAYISPEQTGRMNRNIDYRTDFYSLGVTLYELLARQTPFLDTDPMALVHAHIAKTPLPVHEISDVPVAISNIISKLYEKNAELRYQSAFGLKADLQECLRQINETGAINEFALGAHDVSEALHVSQKLYGRETETRQLLKVFEEVKGGEVRLMLVSGYSGIGKSALINELQKPIVQYRGYFVTGKFDQFKRDIPYSAFIQAFQELIREILTESQASIETWRGKLEKALGANGQVVANVIPEIELITGKLPPVPDLGPAESQNRFNRVFLSFIRVFANQEHPLAIFLDDLQWADSATLHLLPVLLTDAGTESLYLIAAYRDNEVDSSHPLSMQISAIEKTGFPIQRLQLKPLSIDDVNNLISDTLKMERRDVAQLGAVVFGKTNGNPFFTNEFIKSLYEEGLLTLNPAAGVWNWDLTKIDQKGFTDNVVELMSTNIRKLPMHVQEILRTAACIGNKFDLAVIVNIHKQTALKTLDDIWKAIEAGMVLPIGDAYRILRAAEKPTQEQVAAVQFRFVHDRIQQAAYGLVAPEEVAQLHLDIGRQMLVALRGADADEHVFDIVNQLNFGVSLISDEEEREKLVDLNLIAGRRARATTAYGPANRYLAAAASLLPANHWQTKYSQSYELYLLWAECRYLVGDFDESERLLDEILANAQSKLDKGRVYNMRVLQYASRAELEKAIRIGLEGLRVMGMKLKANPNLVNILGEVIKSRVYRGAQKIEDLPTRPAMTDPEKQLLIKSIIDLCPPAYSQNPNLFALLVVKAVNLSLKYGLAPISGYAIQLFSALTGSQLGQYSDGRKFGQAGVDITERFKEPGPIGRAYFACGAFELSWTQPYEATLPILRRGYQKSLEAGELTIASYAGAAYCMYSFASSQNLDDTQQDADAFLKYVIDTKDAYIQPIIESYVMMTRCLRGQTESLLSWKDGKFDEDDYWKRITAPGANNLIWAYTDFGICKYHGGDFVAAREWLERGEKTMAASFALQIWVHDNLYRGLTYAALFDSATPAEQSQFLKSMRNSLKKLKKWASVMPQNVRPSEIILEAEYARVSGRKSDALELYDRAIVVARESNRLMEEALANELAARFYLQSGREKVARTYMTDARYGYERLRAMGKVKYLDEKYPDLMRKVLAADSIRSDYNRSITGNTGTGTTSSFDLGTVLKATQTLSSEIFLDQLLNRVMRIVLENAGAQRGLLLLEKDGKFYIEAEAADGQTDIRVLQSEPVEDPQFADKRVPLAIIQYVQRTGENIVLGDATREGRFTRSPYILATKPKSILCSAIVKQGKISGILYLENNVATNAFTPDRIELLSILSSQAAISLENARLVAEETERQKLQKEMEMAKQVQMSILPRFADDDDYYITAHMTPADQVGGDYYDFYNINGKRWIAIGDVTGHGLNSGLMMLMAQTGFCTYLNSTSNPDIIEGFSAINKTLHMNMMDRTKQELYMTFTALCADSAGNFEHVGKHEDILVYRKASGKVETIKSDGFWMGLVPDVKPMLARSKFNLNSGDFIILFTDGVIEGRNHSGEQFDTPRLVSTIEAHASEGIERVKTEIVKACFDWMHQQDDDLTLFIMQKK